jgi:hypothetical protein
MRKTTSTSFLLIWSMFILLFSACSTEESVVTPTLEAQHWFTENVTPENFEILKYTQEIDWNNAIITSGNEGKMIEVPLLLKKNISTSTKKELLDHHRIMIINPKEEGFKVFHIQIFTKNKLFNNSDPKFNYYSISTNFDGEIYIQEQSYKSGNKIAFDNGKIKKTSIMSKYKEAEEECVWWGYWFEDGHFEPIELIGCFGGGTDAGGNSSGGGYGTGGGGGTGNNNPVTTCSEGYIKDKNGNCVVDTQLIEDYIDDTKLDLCPKEIMDQLKNATNADVTAMLKKLGISKIYNVTIESDPNILRPANASVISKNNYNIKISSNYTNATRLFRASNLLHEITHCFFFSLVDDYTATNDPAIFNDFQKLFQKFVDKQYPGSNEDAHHDTMANKYVNAIATTLQEYNKIDDPGNSIPYQVYEDLAWGGLQEAPVFKTKFPEGSAEYNRIKGRYNGESVNSTINGEKAVGKSCVIK